MSRLPARWFAVIVLGGLASVLVAAVVLLRLGVTDPSPPSLTRDPNPAIPGDLLYLDSGSCLVLARASGESSRSVHCTGLMPRRLFFLGQQQAGYLVSSISGETLVVVDLQSGAEVERRPVGPSDFPELLAPDGTRVFRRDDGRLDLIRDGAVTGTLSFPGLDWAPEHVGWSPDSQWLAFLYFPPRERSAELWLVSRDGAIRGTLATNATGSQVAWRIEGLPAWPAPPR